jgi:uncharacterized protein
MKTATKSASLEQINAFMACKQFAIAGVSRNPQKTGNALFKEMRAKGYIAHAVNPHAVTIEGEKCYPDVESLPAETDALIVVTPPAETLSVVKEAIKKPIRHIWMQLGAENPEAEMLCRENNINCISKKCIFMFLDPVKGVHNFHRFFSKLFGTYPK